MKFIKLIIVLFFFNSFLSANFKREGSGFSETEEFLYDDNKVINYKNQTTWKDSIGNYGISKCLGLIVSDKKNNIIDYKMYCNYTDQNEDKFTHKYERDTDFSAEWQKYYNFCTGNKIYWHQLYLCYRLFE